jgi:hypothetical protein
MQNMNAKLIRTNKDLRYNEVNIGNWLHNRLHKMQDHANEFATRHVTIEEMVEYAVSHLSENDISDIRKQHLHNCYFRSADFLEKLHAWAKEPRLYVSLTPEQIDNMKLEVAGLHNRIVLSEGLLERLEMFTNKVNKDFVGGSPIEESAVVLYYLSKKLSSFGHVNKYMERMGIMGPMKLPSHWQCLKEKLFGHMTKEKRLDCHRVN